VGLIITYCNYRYWLVRQEETLASKYLRAINGGHAGGVQLLLLNDEGQPEPNVEIQVKPLSLDFILGAGIWTDTAYYTWTDNDWALYHDIGFEYEQIWTTWSLIEPEHSHYNFSSVQGQIDYIRRNHPGVKFFARLQGIVLDPLVGTYLNDCAPPPFTGFTTQIPEHRARYLQDLKRYVKTLVSEYQNDIKLWVTPIEINRIDYAMKFFKLKEQPWTLQDAIEIDRCIIDAIREVDSTARIALGTSPPLSPWEPADETRMDPIEFSKLAIDLGLDFDFIAIEVYDFSGDVFYWSRYLQQLASLGKPVFINEAGASAEKIIGCLDESLVEREQAAWYKAMLAMSLSMKEIVGFWILHFKDRKLQQRFSIFEKVGLVDYEGKPKESYYTLRQLLLNLSRPMGLTSYPEGELEFHVLAGKYLIRVLNATGEIQVLNGQRCEYIIEKTDGNSLKIHRIK
jgi:hypothetical protein